VPCDHRQLRAFHLLPPRALHDLQLIKLARIATGLDEVFPRLTVLRDERFGLVHTRQRLRREPGLQEGADILRAHGAVIDQLWQRIHVAVEIDEDMGPLGSGEHIAHFLNCTDEGARAVAAFPGGGDRRHAIFLGDAGIALLLHLVERLLLAVITAALIARRNRQPMVAGKLARDHHQLVTIKGLVDGFAGPRINARPDDLTMLAPVLDVEHEGAGLARHAERFLDAVGVVEILIAAEMPLTQIGIDREAVEVIPAAGQVMGDRLPFGERAMQVRRDRAAHVRHFDIFIVEAVQQMGGEVLPAGTLARRLGNHGRRPRADSNAARISCRSREAGE